MGLLAKKVAADWVWVASLTDLPDVGAALAVKANGQELVLFRLEEGIFCSQASCSHEYSALSEGMVDGCEVFCEKHGSRFDIKTGAVLSPPADRDILTFPVKLEGGDILVFA